MQRQSPISLSYLWFGGEPKVKGHDIDGVIAMAKKLEPGQRLTFFCLDERIEHYKAQLKDYPIEVRSAEAYLQDCLSQPRHQVVAAKAIEIFNELLKPERRTIRDFVTAKNFFSFVILITEGDYIFDSNVKPSDSESVNLSQYDNFHAPLVTFMGDTSPDVWTMYSPKDNPAFATSVFNNFYERWKQTESAYINNTKSKPYNDTISFQVIQAMQESASHQTNAISYWEIKFSGENSIVVPELGIKKLFFNTHLFESKRSPPNDSSFVTIHFGEAVPHSQSSHGLFSTDTKMEVSSPLAESSSLLTAIELGDIEEVKSELMWGEINKQVSSGDRKGETALHVAIRKQYLDIMELLLQNKARIDLVAEYKGKKRTAYELIMDIPDDKTRQRFLETYKSYHAGPTVERRKSL